MQYEITDIKPLDKNTLTGAFNLIVGPFKIEGWTYHTKGEKQWVNPPSKEYIDDEGEKKYFPMIRIPDKDLYWRFQKWATKIVAAELEKMQPATETAGAPEELEEDNLPF